MNAKEPAITRLSLIAAAAVALATTGCGTSHVHTTRTVYLPAPPVVVTPPPATAVIVSSPLPPPPVVMTPAPVVLSPPAPPAPVLMINSVTDFYEPLNAYGRWEMVATYGRVWLPGRIEVGWRPYANGYWQWTDAGWFWASDEPWGWATYHYGRWDWHPQFGWIWVPQTHWAPAWVAWREGSGYVGWAPLRPSVTVGARLTSVNYETAFATRAFVFVEHRRMLEPIRPTNVIVNNTTIINRTVNITNLKVVNQTVINHGPRVEVLERESGRKIHVKPAQEFRQREEKEFATRNRPSPVHQPVARTEPPPVTPAIPRETRFGTATSRPAERPTPTPTPVAGTNLQPTGRLASPNLPPRKVEEPPKSREPARTVETKPKATPPAVTTSPQRPSGQTVIRRTEIATPATPSIPSNPVRGEAERTPARQIAAPAPAPTRTRAAAPRQPAVQAQPRPVLPEKMDATKTNEADKRKASVDEQKNYKRDRKEQDESNKSRNPRTQPR